MIDKLFELLCGLGEPSAPALEPSDIKDANFQQLLSLVSKRRKVLPRSEKKKQYTEFIVYNRRCLLHRILSGTAC